MPVDLVERAPLDAEGLDDACQREGADAAPRPDEERPDDREGEREARAQTRVPLPGVLVSSTRPPSRSMFVRTTSIPTPRPETPVTRAAVEKPGMKMIFRACASVRAAAASGVRIPLLIADWRSISGLHPLAVVLDGDDDLAVRVAGTHPQHARGGLAGFPAALRGLQAVVDRVPHEVAERVADLLEDAAVELGLLALDDELDLLAQLIREVANDAREAVEDGLDREHPQSGHLVLELARDSRELLRALLRVAGEGIVTEP